MNSITLTGNLTRDAELRHLANGDPIASFSVADNQGKDKSAIFWNCSLFGKRAEALVPYLLKGTPVTVIGSVSEREFTDKNTGAARKAMDVRVSDVALQGGKRDEAAPAPQRPASKPAPAARPEQNFEDDIPF